MGVNFSVVTTFSDSFPYGNEMCESLEKYLPDDCDVTVYYEGTYLPQNTDKIKYLNFPMEKMDNFKTIAHPIQNKIIKNLNREDVAYDRGKLWLFDAIRFAWKIYAMHEFHDKCPSKYMIWMDADVQLTSKVPDDFFPSLTKIDTYASYLNRPNKYTESGFLIYDTEHYHHKTFWKRMDEMYSKGKLFNLKHWTDCHAFDYLISLSEKEGVKNNPLVDAKNYDHAWHGSPLHLYSRHFKGLNNKQKLDRIRNES